MDKSPNKIHVEEIQPIFTAKPKTEENGSVYKLQINLHTSAEKKIQFQPQKKKNFIKRRK